MYIYIYIYIYEESNNVDSPCKHGVVMKTYKLNIKQMIDINNIKVICVLIMIFQKNLQNLNKKTEHYCMKEKKI